MKRLLCALLLLAILAQALPISALATRASGKPITEAELQKAFALTGGSETESTFHSGMGVSASMNARQLMDWLDEQLSGDLYSVGHMLGSVHATLNDLEDTSPTRLVRLTGTDQGQALKARCAELQLEVEDLRQTMRFYQDRLQENVTMVEQTANLLNSDLLYEDEIVRYSERIRKAQGEIGDIRDDVVQNGSRWVQQIDQWQSVVDGSYDGDDVVDSALGGWIESVFLAQDEPEVVSAPVTVSGSTRASRLQPTGSVLSAENTATITVMSNDYVYFQMYDPDKKPVEGVKISLRDSADENEQLVSKNTDDRGIASFAISQFAVDDDGGMELYMEADASAQGFQSFCVPYFTIDKGTARTDYLRKDDGTPYVYKATFNGFDILKSEHQVLYSNANWWEFDIKVETRNATAAPVLCYSNGEENGTVTTVEATASDGNVYTYKKKWKQLLNPDEVKKVWLRWGSEGQAAELLLKPIWSVFDEPTDLGSLLGGLSNGFGFSIKIPKIDRTLTVGLTLGDFVPKLSVDPLGSVVLTIGKSFDKLGKVKPEWQNWEAEHWKKETKDAEKKVSEAKDSWRNMRSWQNFWNYPCMVSANFTFGVYLVASGKWQRDDDQDMTTVSVAAAVGGSVTFNVDITKPFVWPVIGCPGYITFNMALTATAAFELTSIDIIDVGGHLAGFNWVWARKLTLQITLTLGLTVGAGIKGFLSLWIKGSGTFNFVFGFIAGRSVSQHHTFSASLSAGVTLLFLTVSMEIVKGSWPLYDSEDSAYSLLNHYMSKGGVNDGEAAEDAGVPQEPETYPELVPKQSEELSGVEDSGEGMRVLSLGDDMYAFLIEKGRIHWYNLTKDLSGSLRLFIEEGQQTYQGDIPIADMKDYAFDAVVGTGTRMDTAGQTHPVGSYFAVVGMCASEFDDDGHPLQKAGNTALYSLMLWRDPSTGILVSGFDGDKRQLGYFRAAWMGGGDGAVCDFTGDKPQINGAQYYAHDGVLPTVGAVYRTYDHLVTVEFSQIQDENAPAALQSRCVQLRQQTMCNDGDYDERIKGRLPRKDRLRIDANENIIRDEDIASGTGNDYARVFTRYIAQATWLAVSRSKNGEGDDGAIELYDDTLATSKKSIALTEGDIHNFAVVPGATTGDGYTLFYADDVGREEGVSRYRLKGLRITPAKRKGDDNLTFSATETSYDVVLPTNNFKARQGRLPLIYWISTGPQDKNGRDMYRMCFAAYDPYSNCMSDDAVFAEFSLPDADMAVRDYFLTEDGTWYITTMKVPAAGDDGVGQGKPQPLSLYSFPTKLAPVLDMKGMVVEDLLVRPGDFDDVTVSVMNSGNLAATALDVALVLIEGNKETLVQTLHADLLNPDNSSLTLADGTAAVSGEKAFYRLEDYDFTARQRDFVVSETRTDFTVEGGALKSADKGAPSSDYITSRIMMPGTMASIKGAIRIPDEWEDDKVIELRVTSVSSSFGWVGAMADACGRNSLLAKPRGVTAAREVTWTADSEGGMRLSSSSGFTAGNSLYATSLGERENVGVTAMHDLDVHHRVYPGPNGEKMLSISVKDLAHTAKTVHLYAEVYLDDAKTPVNVDLRHYADAVSDNVTHNYDMPLTALVDPKAHQKARVVIRATDLEEAALINNEFTLYLDGEPDPLTMLSQPRDLTIQPGESAAFAVKATGGVWPYSYQWQVWDAKHKKWVDLPGYTDATLSRDSVEKKWNGARFRCVITDRAGKTVTSDSATLTVRDSVDTGDHSNLPLYLSVAAISLVLLWLLRRRTGRTA